MLLAHMRDLGEQYGVLDYLAATVANTFSNQPPPRAMAVHTAGDKVVVMGRMENEDTTWVEEDLPE